MNSFNNAYMKKQPPPQRLINQTAEIYLNPKTKNRASINVSHNRRYQPQQNRQPIRKSIDINTLNHPKNLAATIYKNSQENKPFHRKLTNRIKKQIAMKRYQEDDQRESKDRNNRSPYMRQENVGRNSSLNKSSQKIRSNQLIKQRSPKQFYRQPRSSLSQHYDPTIETSLHKRRASLISDERTSLIEESKQSYSKQHYKKTIQILKKYIKLYKGTVQAHYLLGMSYVNTNQFQNGVHQLLHTLEIDPQYKKSLYLVIAIANKKLGKDEDGIQILNQALKLYPDYYDCLVYRGKFYLKRESYGVALQDFEAAIKLNKSKGFAYIGKGTCQKELGKKDEAIRTYTDGLSSDMGHICAQKRGVLLYEQNKLDLALRDLEFCTQVDGYNSSTAHYFKGQIYYRQSKIIQSLLCFEQSLKSDNHHEHVTSSVEMMIKIKIQQKDFYEAYHVLNRAQNVDLNLDDLLQWKLFLEGSLFLMKKKYKDGLDTFSSLLNMPKLKLKMKDIKSKKVRERLVFLKPLIHLYKAFGEICENRLDHAEKEYEIYQQLCDEYKLPKENLSKDYNLLIITTYKSFPKTSQAPIYKALQLIPTKPQPYLLLAFDQINNKFQTQQSPTKRSQLTQYLIQKLSIGIDNLPQLSNNHISSFYFYRSVLYLYRHEFNKAISDIDKAIEKSQDNIPKYFYMRGLIFAVFGNFSQAVQDLSVAINLDQKYAKPYLQRAKCLQLEGNSNQAFLDLQKYITLAPQDQNIHKYAGFLLFQNCAYEDCLSAFSHGAEIKDDYELMLTKAKCHFLLGEFQVSIQLFKKFGEESYNVDYLGDVALVEICEKIDKDWKKEEMLGLIQKVDNLTKGKDEEECKIFKFRDMHQIIGSIHLILGNYSQAIESYTKTLHYFNQQKAKQMEKHFIEDSQEFQDQWSQIEIKYNLSLCYLCLKDYQTVKKIVQEFQNSSQKGKNWGSYVQLVDDLIEDNVGLNRGNKIELDVFEQNHRISKDWPKIQLPKLDIHLSLAFSYPFVEPPELMPEFDYDLFLDFTISKIENKPEAPWINRSEKGLVFTPNLQVYDNLELSITTTKKDENSQKNKPVSQMDQSINMSNSDYQLQTDQLKKKFKLDSLIEMKLKKLMNK